MPERKKEKREGEGSGEQTGSTALLHTSFGEEKKKKKKEKRPKQVPPSLPKKKEKGKSRTPDQLWSCLWKKRGGEERGFDLLRRSNGAGRFLLLTVFLPKGRGRKKRMEGDRQKIRLGTSAVLSQEKGRKKNEGEEGGAQRRPGMEIHNFPCSAKKGKKGEKQRKRGDGKGEKIRRCYIWSIHSPKKGGKSKVFVGTPLPAQHDVPLSFH